MKRLLQIAALVALAQSTLAVAQFCPPMPVANRCDPARQGNPLDTRHGGSIDNTVDFTFRTPLWDFKFERTFVSSVSTWGDWGGYFAFGSPLSGVPAPFGKEQSGDGLRMWHSLYAIAAHRDVPGQAAYIGLQDLYGFVHEFKPCQPLPVTGAYCFADPITEAPATRSRLKMTYGAGPTLIQEDGLILHYDVSILASPVVYFLSSIGRFTSNANEVQLLAITYFGIGGVTQPPSFTTPVCGSASGIPYIQEVSFQPTSNQKLYFEYGLAGQPGGIQEQCVLKRVFHHSAAGTDTPLVTYSYSLNDAGYPQLGSRVNTDGGTPTESYTYKSGTSEAFNRYAFAPGEGLITQKTLDSGKIASSVGGGLQRASVATGPGNDFACNNRLCGGQAPCATLCCTGPTRETSISFNTQGGTSNLLAPAQFTSVYYSMSGLTQSWHSPVLFSKADTLVSGDPGAVSAGSEDWYWKDAKGDNKCGTAAPGVVWAHKDKRGNFTVTPHTVNTDGGSVRIEQTALKIGATDRDGNNALESEGYTYSYGPYARQRIASTTKNSVISGTTTVETTYLGDAISSIVQTGQTRDITGAVLASPRKIGVFARSARQCTAPTTADPLGRTLRIEGPCIVSGTSCDPSFSFPITEFVYESGTATDNTNGRLLSVSRFPNASALGCGTPLITQYTAYSAHGLPTAVTDESGAIRTFTYSGELLDSMTVGGATTSFKYVGDRLTLITYPLGNMERICYLAGSNPACTTGTLNSKPQWRAKLDQSGTWTERIDYEYGAFDGSLVRQTHSRNNVSVLEERFQTRMNRDAHQRPSYQETGGLGGGTGTTLPQYGAFDGADNRKAVSTPYSLSGIAASVAQPFCATNPLACKWMDYDRADRLTQMDSYPSAAVDTTSQRTCLEYDPQGNIRRSNAGCSVANACRTNLDFDGGVTAGCDVAPTDYEYDDFGNVTTITFPWTGNTGARGVTRYEYDALGNVIKKQTAEMAVGGTKLESSYDAIGRLLEVKQQPSNILLYRLGYDQDETTETDCPALTFGNGRLTVREDSFGKTWYRYDQFGNVIQEVRRRSGLTALPPYTNTGCSNGAPNADKNPHTFYSYNANGALTAITYPHGRTVEYRYPASGAMDRPAAIYHSTWTGSAWNATWNPATNTWTGTPTLLLSNISWEPYGGLRAYEFSSTGQWVEYLRQGLLETPPSASTCTSLSASGWGATDGTGRLRAVTVSDAPFSLGTPTGNIFKQIYTWRGDQLVKQQTCHRNTGTPQVEDFNYDMLPRVTSSGDGTVTTAFGYTQRGNRLTTTLSGAFNCGQDSTWWWTLGPWQIDLPYSTRWGTAFGGPTCNSTRPASAKYNYWYDRDGRRITTWDETNRYNISTNYAQNIIGAGFENVYKTATLTLAGASPVVYSYFYDALGRRRAKTTPWSSTDEYFYDLGHQMLSDQGNNLVGSSPTELPEDDYVWLGGRPVTFIRSKFNPNTRARTADSPASYCNRDGETRLCGSFMLVTDYLGKPVVSLDRGHTSGTATYEAFGYANRKQWRFGSPHNQSSSNVALTTITPQMPSTFDGPVRLLLSRSNFSSLSSLSLAGAVQTGLQGNQAHAWSNWQTAAGNSWSVVWNGNSADYGVDIEAYEIRAKEAGTTWAWTPLRFPGQYYDQETDLHENWNRYYDPSTGRYLSPEPLLQVPRFLKTMARNGTPSPTYAYAANNPIGVIDSDGRKFVNLTPAERLLIDQLMLDPNIGRDVAKMDSRTDIEISLSERPCSEMLPAGGGDTSLELGPRGGVDKYFVKYNFSAANATASAYFGMPQTPLQLIAHELGHVSAYLDGIGPGPASNIRALDWENTIRGWPQRGAHNYNCSKPVTCPP